MRFRRLSACSSGLRTTSRQGLLVSLSRQGLFLIPLLIILPKYMGINGILAASPISDALAFIVSITMVLVSFRKYREEKTPLP